MQEIIIVLLFIVAFFVLGVAFYNTIVSNKLKVDNAFATIDTQLNKRFDLIPNLIEVAKSYIKHEENIFLNIAKIKTDYSAASTPEEKIKISSKLNDNLKSFFALAESYPDLKSNELFLNLQTELADVEDKIAFSRQFYNDAVFMYNKSIMTFPQNLIATMFRFEKLTPFTVDDSKKDNVEVKF